MPGVGRIEVLSSDTREIEVVLDPRMLTAAGLTVPDVAAALKAQNCCAGRPLPVRPAAPRAGVRPLASARSRQAPVLVKNGATIRVTDLGEVVPGRPDRTLLVTGNGGDAVSISISQQIGANILP